MFVTIKELHEAATGVYDNVPEADRALLKVRTEAPRRFVVKTEKNNRVRATQYCFHNDVIISSSIIKNGEQILLLPSFGIMAGSLADLLIDDLPEIEREGCETYDINKDEMNSEDNSKEKVFMNDRIVITDSITLANFDTILREFAQTHALPYLSPKEADFSVYAKGAGSNDMLYAYVEGGKLTLYLKDGDDFKVSECSGMEVFNVLIKRLYTMHKEEIIEMGSEA